MNTKKLKNRLVFFVVSGACSGLSPIASGTVGSLGAILPWLLTVHIFHMDPFGTSIAFAALALVFGTYCSKVYLASDSEIGGKLNRKGKLDPKEIVIDEWLGMFIALAALSSVSFLGLAAAFFLFRFFDIAKIWPASALEKLPGAYGIMLDDLMAGAYSYFCLVLLERFF